MQAASAVGERPHYRTLEEDTVPAMFQATAQRVPERVALRALDDSVSVTWGEYEQRVRSIAAGLAALGLERGQTIALMLVNRPEFHLVDTAAMHLGASPFSIYNTYTPEQIGYLIGDAGNRIVVTERAFLETIENARAAGASDIDHVVLVDGEAEGAISLEELERGGDAGFDFDAAWRAVAPDDVLTLIYTSGTTGPPKGVQITHRNIVETVRSYAEIVDFPDGGRIVSYLPMAHIAERNVSHYLPMAFGFTVTCCPNARELIAALPQVHPTWFFAVPRIWEKLKATMEAGFENEQDAERKRAMQEALELGLERVRKVQAGEEVPEELERRYRQADEQIFSKLRTALGLDELDMCNVGAAPTPREVIEFFHAIGVPLAELWGMSETTGAGTVNPPERIKIGTVGPAAPGIEVKLADEDREILIRGPIVMKGYRNQEDKTREAIDGEGWLHTGDIGELDEDGYLKIVDRKKELIINAAGKNMSPANIEAKVKTASPLIGQAVAIGDGRPYNTALITLDPDAIPGWAREHGVEDASPRALAGDERVVAAVQDGVDRANEQLARVEQIKKFRILPTDWEPGGDELTPTMKLKRKPIAEKYADEIEALYSG